MTYQTASASPPSTNLTDTSKDTDTNPDKTATSTEQPTPDKATTSTEQPTPDKQPTSLLIDEDGAAIKQLLDKTGAKTVNELLARYTVDSEKLGGVAEDDPSTHTIDFEALNTEYNTTGTISARSRSGLISKGIPNEIIDTYLKGIESISKHFQDQVTQLVGGADKYKQLTSWASENLSPNEIDTFNHLISTGNIDDAKFAILAIRTIFESKHGALNPQFSNLPSSQTLSTNPLTFNSIDEVVTAMSDPRYAKDSAYRKQVEQRLVNSKVFR